MVEHILEVQDLLQQVLFLVVVQTLEILKHGMVVLGLKLEI